jgi:hypothetical protein
MNLQQESSPAIPVAAFLVTSGTLRAIGGAAAYVVLGALTLSPLLWAAIPPLVDYPNHLARMSVLLHSGDGSAVTTNYVADWRLLPNLAMDLIVPALARFIPLEVAGRLFIAATMVQLLAGTAALHRVLHGRIGFWPLTAFLFLYNAVLWLGFVNYLFGLGLSLLAFSLWIGTQHWPMARRLIVFAPIACLLFVMHLFAFGVYGLLVGSYEAGKIADRRWLPADLLDGAKTLLQFGPAGVLWLVSSGGTQITAYGGLRARIFALFAPAMFDYAPSMLDALILLFPLVLIPAALGAGALKLSSAMRWPVIAMLLVAIVMPEFLNGSWGAQIRLPVALVFVVIASTQPAALRRATVTLFVCATLLLLGTRIWSVTQSWREMDGKFAELRAALDTIPEGVRLLAVQSPMNAEAAHFRGVSAWIATQTSANYDHIASLAVLDRGAFTADLFTGWYPVEASSRNAGMPNMLYPTLTPEELIARAHADPPTGKLAPRDILGELPCCFNWSQTFDFALWIDFGQTPQTLLPELQPWASGSFFHIYKIKRS